MRVEAEDTPGVIFQQKEREGTAWLSITYEGDEATVPTETQALVDALRADGWQTSADRGRREVPPLGGIAEITMTKPGSDLFGGWTREEKTKNLAKARTILKRHGHARVELQRLPWQEFL